MDGSDEKYCAEKEDEETPENAENTENESPETTNDQDSNEGILFL